MEKLSAYTIAANCTDITDCNYGIDELWDASDRYKKAGRKAPEYIYKRIEKLEAKRDKCSLKEHGMKYDEWILSRFDKLEGASDGYIEAYKGALKKWLKYQNYKGDKRNTVYHILRDNADSAREFLWQTPDGLPNIMKIGDWYFDEDITDYDTMVERIFGGLQGTKKAKRPTNEGKYIDAARHNFFMRLITKGRVKVEAAQELSLMLVNAMVEISQWKKRQYESPENTTDSLLFQNRMAAHDIVTRITGELLDKGVRVKSAEAICDMIMDCLLAFADWKDQQHEAAEGLQGLQGETAVFEKIFSDKTLLTDFLTKVARANKNIADKKLEWKGLYDEPYYCTLYIGANLEGDSVPDGTYESFYPKRNKTVNQLSLHIKGYRGHGTNRGIFSYDWILPIDKLLTDDGKTILYRADNYYIGKDFTRKDLIETLAENDSAVEMANKIIATTDRDRQRKLLKLKAKAIKMKLELMKIDDEEAPAPEYKVGDSFTIHGDQLRIDSIDFYKGGFMYVLLDPKKGQKQGRLLLTESELKKEATQEWLQIAADKRYKGLTSTTDGNTMKILSAGDVIGTLEAGINKWGTIYVHFCGRNSHDCYINSYADKYFKQELIDTTDTLVEHALYPDTNDRSAEFAEQMAKIVNRLAETDEHKGKNLRVGISDYDFAGRPSKKVVIRCKGSKSGNVCIYHQPECYGEDYTLMCEAGTSCWGTGFNSKKDNIEEKLQDSVEWVIKGIGGNN